MAAALPKHVVWGNVFVRQKTGAVANLLAAAVANLLAGAVANLLAGAEVVGTVAAKRLKDPNPENAFVGDNDVAIDVLVVAVVSTSC
jgi:hypothetical protein